MTRAPQTRAPQTRAPRSRSPWRLQIRTAGWTRRADPVTIEAAARGQRGPGDRAAGGPRRRGRSAGYACVGCCTPRRAHGRQPFVASRQRTIPRSTVGRWRRVSAACSVPGTDRALPRGLLVWEAQLTFWNWRRGTSASVASGSAAALAYMPELAPIELYTGGGAHRGLDRGQRAAGHGPPQRARELRLWQPSPGPLDGGLTEAALGVAPDPADAERGPGEWQSLTTDQVILAMPRSGGRVDSCGCIGGCGGRL